MKNEIKRYNNEIDLVDLLKILIKNKGLILLTTIIITIFSIGGALYLRSNKVDRYQQKFNLIDYGDSYYGEKAQLRMKNFDAKGILLDDKIVNKFYNNEDFNRYFLEKTNGEKVTLDGKRNFLNNSIKIDKVMDKDNIKYYSVTSNIKNNKELSKNLITIYIDIISKEKMDIMIKAIDIQDDFIVEKKDLYEKKVKEDVFKIAKVIKKQPASILENQDIMSILSITNPTLLQEMDSNKELQKKYYNQAIGIEGLKEDKNLDQQIEKLSSIYEVKEKSKSIMIIAIGIMLGLFLGIMLAFMKEFFANVDLKK